jgi:hypothetical protein
MMPVHGGNKVPMGLKLVFWPVPNLMIVNLAIVSCLLATKVMFKASPAFC